MKKFLKILIVLFLFFFGANNIYAADNYVNAEKCPSAISGTYGGVNYSVPDLTFIDNDGLFDTGIFSNGYCCPLGFDRISDGLFHTPGCQNINTGEFGWGTVEDNSSYCPKDTVIIKGFGALNKNICWDMYTVYEGEFLMGCESGEIATIEYTRYTDYNNNLKETITLDADYCDLSHALKAPADHDCICFPLSNNVHSISTIPSGTTCEDYCNGYNEDVFKDIDHLSSGGVAKSNDPVTCDILGGTDNGVWTAIGCIPVETGALSNWAMFFGMALGALLSVFRIIQGSIMVMTSTGNPEKLQEGRSIITSALIGIVIIVSAVILLYAIGVDILGIDSFGFDITWLAL